jgi:hypothetical protein
MLDGDDYWTSPAKLQTQVDYLERHAEVALCFHNLLKCHEDSSRPPSSYCNPQLQEFSSADDLLARNFIPTSSVMFRNGLVTSVPAWYDTLPTGDRAMWMLYAQHGQLGYVREVLGVYRVHAGGLWSSQSLVDQVLIAVSVSSVLGAHLGYSPQAILDHCLPAWSKRLSSQLVRQGGLGEFAALKQSVDEFMAGWPSTLPLSARQKAQVLGRVYLDLALALAKSARSQVVRHRLVQALRQEGLWLRKVSMLALQATLAPNVTGPSLGEQE